MDTGRFLVQPGAAVDLAGFDTRDTETFTAEAPWYIIPADRKWFRNLVISQVLVDTLESLDMDFPKTEEGLDDLVVE